jgi:hypothetical protein
LISRHFRADNGVILLYIYTAAIDIITDSDILQALLGENNSKLISLLSTLDPEKVLNMVADIIAITQNPTEVYWTFSQYVAQETNSFSYPKGITAQDARMRLTGWMKLLQQYSRCFSSSAFLMQTAFRAL